MKVINMFVLDGSLDSAATMRIIHVQPSTASCTSNSILLPQSDHVRVDPFAPLPPVFLYPSTPASYASLVESSFLKIIRCLFRSVWLGATLVFIAVDFLFQALRHGGSPPWTVRTHWLQRSAAAILRVFNVGVRTTGALPHAGLLVSNHLTYLDIIAIGSLMPTVFVSKAEVKNWPVFGWCAQRGGTLFIDRTRRTDVSRISREIQEVLNTGQVVVLFPEGTSSNGHEVLPLKSSLLEPVCASNHPLSVAHISYELDQGSVENDVCYWGGMTFLPHVVRLMTLKNIRAQIRFVPVVNRASDRKDLARQLHKEIVRLKITAPDDRP